ncbi:MAG: cupin domain-containing protein [Pseudomonadota bacterium]
MPKIDTQAWQDRSPGPHPISGQDDGAYAEIVLGDAAGLTQFGARLERLGPGARSAHRHWHETEDELVVILSGELVLIEETETRLVAGDAAGWAASAPVGHCLENRSNEPAVLLVIGSRAAADVVHYPDHGMVLHREGSTRRFTRPDGTPITADP